MNGAGVCRVMLAIITFGWFTIAVGAQQHPAAERGLRPELVYELNGFDTVNIFNGNLNAEVPLGLTYPVGGGLAYRFTLRYAGNVWSEDETCPPLTECRVRYYPQTDNGGMGWKMSFGRLTEPPSTSTPGMAGSMWMYESSDGSEHHFYDVLHDPPCSATITTNCDPVTAGVRYTRDGTFLRMKDLSASVRVIEFPSGERHRYVEYLTDRWRLDYVYNTYSTLDTAGVPLTNFVRFEYVLNAQGVDDWRISDSHGRAHWVRFQPRSATTTIGPIVDRVELAAFNGYTATYDLSYTSMAVKPPCLNSVDDSPHTVNFLGTIVLPTGESWSFAYNQPAAACSDSSGTMTRATMPTLGSVGWSYRRYSYAGITADSLGVMTRAQYDMAGAQTSLTTYTPSSGSTTVTTHAKRTSDNTWQPDRKTINYHNPSYGASFGLPYTTASRSGAVPNPDGSAMGRYLSTETFDCDPVAGTCSTVADRATYVKFEMDAVTNCPADYPCNRDRNRRMVSTRTLYVSDGGRYADIDHSNYDGLGHYRLVRTGGNFGRADARDFYVAYNTNSRGWDPVSWSGFSTGTYQLDAGGNRVSGYTTLGANDAWVLGTFPSSYVAEGGVQATVQTCFNARTGFLHRRRLLAGTAAGTSDLLSVSTPDAGGNVAREEQFGGDKQSLGTSSLCTMSLPVHDQYSSRADHVWSYGVLSSSRAVNAAGVALSFYSLRRDIDLSSALVKRTYDSADVSADYVYDTAGRLTWIRPVSDSTLPQRTGETGYDYTNATSATSPATVTKRDYILGGAFDLTRTTTILDGFGRIAKEQVLLPSGANSTRETTYDYAGRVATRSEWMNTATPTKKTTYTYDLWGRPTLIVPADGTTHQVTVTYSGVSSTTSSYKVATSKDAFNNPIESSQSLTETYDRQGRLWKVTERPDGPATAGNVTEYTYDWGNRLTRVCQNLAGTVCGQTRIFNYDRRGLLTSEQHPEKGLNGNGIVSFTYDASGQPVRKLEGTVYGLFDLTYTYDRAGRLTEIRQTPDPAAPVTKILKEMTYDSATGWGKGKVWQAKRHNHDRFTNNVVVTETYTYQARDGRISSRQTCVGSAGCTGTTDKKFTTAFTYQDQGMVENITYPDCTAPAGCNASDTGRGRTVTNTYANGLINGIYQGATPYATVSYHDNGMLNTIAHGNGVNAVFSRDSNSIRRPASTLVQLGTNPAMWSTGVYSYDGAGNIKKIGADAFLYDGISRLRDATVDYVGSASQRRHRFAYDVYGNLTNKYTSTNGGAEIDNNFYIASATNRMSSPWPAQFDEAGNMTGWNNGSMTWTYDGLGAVRAAHTSGGDLVFFYTAGGERIWAQNTSTATGRWSIRDLEGRVLRQYTTSGPVNFETFSFAKDYIYRENALLASVTASGTFHHHLDHLGNTRLVTNASGVEVSRHKFFPFGEEVSIYSTAAELKKFTGHERDYYGGTSVENVEYVDYMHARYYSPVWGRFLAPDPILGRPQAPQSWNRYSYAWNNPMMRTDPTGMAITVWGERPRDEFMPDEHELWSDLRDFFDFGSGIMNGFGSDMLLGAGRVEMPGNHAYSTGQQVGDLAAMLFGGFEMISGANGTVGGVVLTATGGGAVVGVPAIAVSAGVMAHGGAVTAVATTHLMSGIKQRKAGVHGTHRGRESKRTHDSVVDRVCKELELTKDERQRLHRELDGSQSYDEILREAKAMFNK